MLIWMKQMLIWFNLQKDGTGNGLPITSRILLQYVCSYKCQFFKPGLSSSYDGWAKYKEKVPDVPEPNQNVEKTCNSKLKFT